MKRVLFLWTLFAALLTMQGEALHAKDAAVDSKIIAEPTGNTIRYEKLYARLRAFSSAGRTAGSYGLCKARAWLDFAFDVRAQRDSAGMEDEALNEAQAQIELMAGDETDLDAVPLASSPHWNRLRDDLWQLTDDVRHGKKGACAACSAAELEVQLVQAGHADQQLGWRHARPYLQQAERLARDVEVNASSCPKPVSPQQLQEQSPPQPILPAEPLPAKPVTDGAGIDRVHFAFDSGALSDKSVGELKKLAVVMQAHAAMTLTLSGHADERGEAAYNLQLSRRRAMVVADYLAASGVDRSRLTVHGAGTMQPASAGRTLMDRARNRRVEWAFAEAANADLRKTHDAEEIGRRKSLGR
jgi:OmpA-OmpF porin, OOP family